MQKLFGVSAWVWIIGGAVIAAAIVVVVVVLVNRNKNNDKENTPTDDCAELLKGFYNDSDGEAAMSCLVDLMSLGKYECQSESGCLTAFIDDGIHFEGSQETFTLKFQDKQFRYTEEQLNDTVSVAETPYEQTIQSFQTKCWEVFSSKMPTLESSALNKCLNLAPAHFEGPIQR
jgi:hypothetical protein